MIAIPGCTSSSVFILSHGVPITCCSPFSFVKYTCINSKEMNGAPLEDNVNLIVQLDIKRFERPVGDI